MYRALDCANADIEFDAGETEYGHCDICNKYLMDDLERGKGRCFDCDGTLEMQHDKYLKEQGGIL